MATPYDLEVGKGTWSSAFFDTVGNETGDICLSEADGSITPVDFKHTAPFDKYVYVHQLTGYLRANKLTSGGFGEGPALLNGLGLWLKAGDFERQLTNQKPIKAHMDFAAYTNDIQVIEVGTVTWRFQITDDGTPFRLHPGQSLLWRVNDDLTAQNIICFHVRLGSVVVPAIYR